MNEIAPAKTVWAEEVAHNVLFEFTKKRFVSQEEIEDLKKIIKRQILTTQVEK